MSESILVCVTCALLCIVCLIGVNAIYTRNKRIVGNHQVKLECEKCRKYIVWFVRLNNKTYCIHCANGEKNAKN